MNRTCATPITASSTTAIPRLNRHPTTKRICHFPFPLSRSLFFFSDTSRVRRSDIMDHSHMDHSDHGGHGGGGMDDMCSMSMLFTWDTKNLCIVFRQWHIRSTTSLLLSLVAVVLIAVGYEGLRALSRRYERAVDKRIEALPRQNQASVDQRAHLIKAGLYAAQNFYAFMLMLIFMTYNGWVIVAVTVGAFLGYVLFGKTSSSTKENACH